MKGCALSALISFLGLILAIVAISAGLRHFYRVHPLDAAGVAIFAGLFAWVSVNLAMSTVKALRERAALRAGIAGTAPADGRPAIIVGRIDATGPALRAPLSGRECVAYWFEIYAYEDTGKSSSKVVYCDGTAITPSIIVTPTGSVRLFAVPEIECDEAELDFPAARERAAEKLRTTPFVPAPGFSKRPGIEQQWNDVDGDYCREVRRVEGDVDIADIKLSERHIERGAQVCVFGPYSVAKRAIVADPHDWSKLIRIMKGDPETIVKQLAASARRRGLGAVLLGGAAAGAIWAFVASLS
jgi:hypothetical protein